MPPPKKNMAQLQTELHDLFEMEELFKPLLSGAGAGHAGLEQLIKNKIAEIAVTVIKDQTPKVSKKKKIAKMPTESKIDTAEYWRYECTSGSSNKFYELAHVSYREKDGTVTHKVYCGYGKIGANPITQMKYSGTNKSIAEQTVHDIKKDKLKKKYHAHGHMVGEDALKKGLLRQIGSVDMVIETHAAIEAAKEKESKASRFANLEE